MAFAKLIFTIVSRNLIIYEKYLFVDSPLKAFSTQDNLLSEKITKKA